MKKYESKLVSSEFRLKLGFLYQEYKDSFYFWEIVKIVQKFSNILIINLFYSEKIIKCSLIVIV